MATSTTIRGEAAHAPEMVAKTAATSLFSDYAILLKPRVSLMVLITAAGSKRCA